MVESPFCFYHSFLAEIHISDSSNQDYTQSLDSLEMDPLPQERCCFEQKLQQQGKYSVNLREGKEVHIGDRIYQADVPTIRQIVREELQTHHKEYGNPIKAGLLALMDLMKLPVARSAVIAFRVDFQAACQQIDIIASLKELHDELHTLDQCYRSIARDDHLKTFVENEIALESLIGYHQALQIVIANVKEVATRQVLRISNLTWLDNLEQAQLDLQRAIENASVDHLQKTVWLLERVLAKEPSRINTSLNNAAGTLRLPALLDATTTIWQQLQNGDVDLAKLSQFKIGVEAITDLDNRLTALIVAHDYLQEMDLDLRRIEASLDLDLTELELSWPELKVRNEILFENQSDDWALSFKRACFELDTALLGGNPAKIRRCFWSYQRQSRHSFYKVDVTLKRLCDELRKIGTPLADILRIIE